MVIKDKDCVIVFANGDNSVVVPITVFKDLLTTRKTLTEIIGSRPKEVELNEITFGSDNKERVLVWEVDEDSPVFGHDEENKEDEESHDKLFESSYFGCGGPSAIIARPIKFGELKLFTYDLD